MSSRQHDFTWVEIKAGVMVIVSVAVLILFVAVLNGLRPPENVKTFYTYFTDTKGLNRGGDVRFGGVKEGRVVRVEPDTEDQSRIGVAFQVRAAVPVNTQSKAFVTQTTLTAEPHLETTTGQNGASLLEDGALIPEAADQASGMFGALDEVAAGLVPVLADVKTLLGVEARNGNPGETDRELVTIADLFSNVDQTVQRSGALVQDVREVVGDNSDEISAILSKIQGVEDSAKGLVDQLNDVLAENRAGIKASVTTAQHIVDSVAGVCARLEAIASVLEATLGNAERLSGDAQRLVHDNQPVIADLVLDLRETVRHLKTFSRTIADEPEAVIRGKSAQGRK